MDAVRETKIKDDKSEDRGRDEGPGEGGGKDDKGNGGGGQGGGRDKVEITVVVNGQPVEIEANPNQPLHAVRSKALEQTQNVAQPPENWEFKTEAGEVLDTDKKVGEFGFGKEVTLFLSLKAGVAGA